MWIIPYILYTLLTVVSIVITVLLIRSETHATRKFIYLLTIIDYLLLLYSYYVQFDVIWAWGSATILTIVIVVLSKLYPSDK